jgi:hypothetical protein
MTFIAQAPRISAKEYEAARSLASHGYAREISPLSPGANGLKTSATYSAARLAAMI